jgi:transcription elongation factor GreA
MAVSYYTAEGLQRMKDELNQLKTTGRSMIAAAIAEARDKGDLSENAEYDAAKDAQGLHELKISKLEELVGNARIIDESTLDATKIGILSKIKIKNLKSGKTNDYLIVAEEEADLKLNKMSIKSPIAKGLLGLKAGEKAKVQVPAGEIEFEVLEVGL